MPRPLGLARMGEGRGRDAGRHAARDAGRHTARDAGRHTARDAGRDFARQPGRDVERGQPQQKPQQENSSQGEPPPPTFYDFTQNTTFHGVKYVFEKGAKKRRFLWVIAVLAACGLFIWQVGQRTHDYYRYETNVNVELVYATEMPFPAVTICNQNNFRTSVTVDRQLYSFIDEVYSTRNTSVQVDGKYSLHNIQTEEFMRAAAHQITDLIDSCTWQGQPCDIEEDFVTTLTDLGVCYTFNSGHKKDPIMVTEAGSAFGLVLILNVEQYEYMRGPQSDAGIKLMLHDQGEFPLVKEQGFAVAPGSHTLAGIERTITHNMEPPFGECNATDTVPLANCLINCRTRFVAEKCGCRNIYMNNVADVEVCDMEREFMCARHQSVEAMRQQSSCECKQLCEYEQYAPSLSYAQLSKFNIDRIVLNEPVRRDLVLSKFLLARELSQRRVQEVAEADEEKLQEIKHLVHVLWQDIQDIKPAMRSDDAFGKRYDIVPLLARGDTMMRDDAVDIMVRFLEWERKGLSLQGNKFLYVERFLNALFENFLEINKTAEQGTFPGFFTKAYACMQNPLLFPLFPLPNDYDDVHKYFNDHSRRKKRSHVSESPTSQDFYLVDLPVYEKLHTLDDCGHYLALKQEFAKDLIARHLDLTVDRQHADNLYQGLHSLFRDMFHNTSKSPFEFPKHQPCMDLLEKIKVEMFENIDTIVDVLSQYAKTDSYVSLQSSLDNLATRATKGYAVEDPAELCFWPFSDYLAPSKKDNNMMMNFNRDMEMAYTYFPMLRITFSNLADFSTEIYDQMRDYVLPSMQLIDHYLAGNASKLQLSETFSSLNLQKSLTLLHAVASDFISASREFDRSMKSLVFHQKAAMIQLLNTTIPIVSNDVFWNWKVTKYIQRFAIPKFVKAHGSFHDGAGLLDISLQVIDMYSEDYARIIGELKLRLPPEVEAMSETIQLMRTELESYAEDSKMNKAFFMENFAQIDIFYKSMTYTDIIVQNAFPFISLLSEFGGFMGLLLGASCLTLMEIIDHLITLALAKFRPAHKRSPTVDSVQPIKTTAAWM